MALNRVGSFWSKKDKNDQPFLSGTVSKDLREGTNLFLFKNKEKKAGGADDPDTTGKNYPDYHLFTSD